jgi:hypothetical protein
VESSDSGLDSLELKGLLMPVDILVKLKSSWLLSKPQLKVRFV